MQYTLLGIFSNRMHAESAIADLQSAGFSPNDISLIQKNSPEASRYTQNTKSSVFSDMTTGALVGAILGGGISALITANIVTANIVSFPTLAAVLDEGPLSSLGLPSLIESFLTGVLGGGVTGAILGFLLGLLIPDKNNNYIQAIHEGGMLLTVPVNSNSEAAARGLLNKYQPDMIRTINHNVQETVEEEGLEYRRPDYKPEASIATPQPTGDYYPNMAYYNQITPTRAANPTPAAQPTYNPNSLRTGKIFGSSAGTNQFIQETNYPISKRDLVRFAEQRGGDETDLSLLEQLPDKIYDNSLELATEIGRVGF
jgi:gas vesicle protein